MTDVLSGVEASSSSSSDPALQERLHAAQQDFRFPPSALAVQLSTARAGLSHCPEARLHLQPHWPMAAAGSGPRYQVFRDLRRRGFYLTSAGKFGGDFLVYPGEQSTGTTPVDPLGLCRVKPMTLFLVR